MSPSPSHSESVPTSAKCTKTVCDAVQCSVTQSCLTVCDPMGCSMPAHQAARPPCPSPTPRVYSNSSPLTWVVPSNHLVLCHPLLLPPSEADLSQHQSLFKWVSSLHQAAKYWNFSFSISPFNEYSGLSSFRMDCWISLVSRGLSRVFSNTTDQKHQLFSAQLSL